MSDDDKVKVTVVITGSAVNDPRENAIEHLAEMLHGERRQWRCHWSVATRYDQLSCRGIARGLLDGNRLVAIDQSLVEALCEARARKAAALAEMGRHPYGEEAGEAWHQAMRAKNEAHEAILALREAITAAVLEQLWVGK